MSIFDEAKKLKKTIVKIASEQILAQTKDCLRLYKATVATAVVTVGDTIGVKLVGDETILNLPFSNAAGSATVNSVVWVQVIANNFRNAIVVATDDITFRNSGGMIDLSEYQKKADAGLLTADKTVVGGINENYQALQNKVPFRLAGLPATTGFRQGGQVYVDNGTTGFRMEMTALKDLNTKIVVVNEGETADSNKITEGDFVVEINQ